MTSDRIEVRAGMSLTIDVLRWNEDWDFDCPVAVLRPVIRFSPNGDWPDEIAENICIDAVVDGFLSSEGHENGLIDRQYSFKTLKRRWNQARRGREFGRKQYKATRFTVSFLTDRDGELTFELTEVGPPKAAS